jgi:hypothetical protein
MVAVRLDLERMGVLDLDDPDSGIMSRIFKRIDSILGSIASVFPLGDLLKEYKEHVEISLEALEDAKPVQGGLYSIVPAPNK